MHVVILERDELAVTALKHILFKQGLQSQQLHCFNDIAACNQYLRQYAADMLVVGDVIRSHKQYNTLIKNWLQRYPTLMVVIWSQYHSMTSIKDAIELGVRAFVDKQDTLDTCFQVILDLPDGCIYRSPRVGEILEQRITDANRLNIPEYYMDALHCFATGLNISQTALALGKDRRTIYRIRCKLRELLEINSFDQLIDEARRRGLLGHDM